MTRMGAGREAGVTLIELIVAIVIIGIALVGVLLVLNRVISASGDPMVQQQAIAIGEAYIEEISGKPYADPDGSDTGETRATFDDVADYNRLPDNVVRDQTGTAMTGLGSYAVKVSVADSTLNGAPAKLITVTVSHGDMANVVLADYRLDLQP
ncbi:MAG TPA: prepilin-type N-terminal cleavage/methylation domain-containing protein [Gammaproteobacteria bacterium]|nr:prepilin-type N-terminal cleavage/methylation domain-containing protein [Gammaproteobacteria bacterium]